MFQSLLEFTLRPYKKRECIEEYSLSTTLTETDKKSTEQTSTAKSEERELIPPPTNFDDRMKNIESKVKSAFTRTYNKEVVLPYATNIGNITKKAKVALSPFSGKCFAFFLFSF